MTRFATLLDGTVVSCSRKGKLGQSCGCGRFATHHCDGRVPVPETHRTRRCEVVLCERCVTRVETFIEPDADFCDLCLKAHQLRWSKVLPSIPGALVAYCDGSGFPRPLPCGCGVVIFDQGVAVREASLHLGLGTNNAAELGAVRTALWLCGTKELRNRTLIVRSDSMYTINALTSPHAPYRDAPNEALIVTIRRRLALRGRDSVVFEHVHGHTKEPGNERADVLAGLARLRVPSTSAKAPSHRSTETQTSPSEGP